MDLCGMLGTEPYVNGNVGSGAVREMSNWVEYLTGTADSPMGHLRRENGREDPWRVPFWGIGNEAWGCGGNMRAEYYADLARQFGTFCRDHGDNKLFRIAAGASDDNYSWTETLMKAVNCLGCRNEPRGYFQGVSFHYYTIPGTWEKKGIATEFSVEDYYRTMVNARKVDELITGHSRVMDCYDPKKRLGLVLDEWGTWWDVEEGTNPGFLYQQNTLRDALVASVHFDIFHQHAERLAMANIAQTVNVLQAMVLTAGDHLVLTPTYHVFEMNKGHHDAASLQVHLQSSAPTREVDGDQLETLSLSASVKDGSVLFSLTNLDAEQSVVVDLDLRGRRLGVTTARILTAETLQSHNVVGAAATVDVQDFDGVATSAAGLRVELPAHSFVTISAPLQDSA